MQEYLENSDIINWTDPDILALSRQLSVACDNDSQIAQHCFEWVRDNIRHSWDYQLNPVTCRASDVLQYRTGYCYAKSHLLAALLRANQIPAGLCYQRLSVDDNGAPYCLHGLNAVYLADIGWYRIDARGNKEGIDARFSPPYEQLAFATDDEHEIDFQEILVKPLHSVVDVLNSSKTFVDVYNNLPDAESIA
jgi:transglutaminase-like putative cysteine protease